MNKVYLGIDVGSKGFITLNVDGEFTFHSIADLDFYQISDILRNIRNNYKDVVCTIEEVHAIHNSSAKATFAFGEINGILKGLLIANKIPYHLVQPKVWQSVIWENKDIVVKYKTIKDKKTNKEKSKKCKFIALNNRKKKVKKSLIQKHLHLMQQKGYFRTLI